MTTSTALKSNDPSAATNEDSIAGALLSIDPVRRVIRHRFTQEYYCGSGWTRDHKQALVFSDALEAAAICVNHHLWNIELVLQPGSVGTDLFRTSLR